jgi:hypothetical protein
MRFQALKAVSVKVTAFWDAASCSLLQGMKNNSELELCHSKRRKEDGNEMGKQRHQEICLSVNTETKNIFFPFFFNLDTIGDILIHRIIHCNVFCEPKEV